MGVGMFFLLTFQLKRKTNLVTTVSPPLRYPKANLD
jgi:hypothetical protein